MKTRAADVLMTLRDMNPEDLEDLTLANDAPSLLALAVAPRLEARDAAINKDQEDPITPLIGSMGGDLNPSTSRQNTNDIWTTLDLSFSTFADRTPSYPDGIISLFSDLLKSFNAPASAIKGMSIEMRRTGPIFASVTYR